MKESTEELEDQLMQRMRAAGLQVPSRAELLEQCRSSERIKSRWPAHRLARKASDHIARVIADLLSETTP